MAVLVKVNPGDQIQAHQLNQIIDALIGTAGQGVAISISAVNDASQYALTVQNDEATNSRGLNVLNSAGTSLIRTDSAGVTLGSPLNLAANSITSGAIADGTIQTADLADNSVTSAKIVDGTIIATDLSATLGNFGAGQNWTGIGLSQGGAAPTLTITYAHSLQIGKMVIVQALVTITGPGAAGNDIIMTTLPVAVRNLSGYAAIGSFVYLRSAIGFYAGTAVAPVVGQIKFIAGGSDGTNMISAYLGNTTGPSFAMAANDQLSVALAYEAA